MRARVCVCDSAKEMFLFAPSGVRASPNTATNTPPHQTAHHNEDLFLLLLVCVGGWMGCVCVRGRVWGFMVSSMVLLYGKCARYFPFVVALLFSRFRAGRAGDGQEGAGRNRAEWIRVRERAARTHLNYSNQPHMDCRFRKRSFRVR